MSKVRQIRGIPQIFCPGCETPHAIDVRWKYNYKPEFPTFKPDVKFVLKGTDKKTGQRVSRVCRFTITDGMIEFWAECTHALKGQRVELPSWDQVD